MGSRVLRTKPFQKPAPPSEGPFQSRGKSGVSGALLVMTKGTALTNETQKEARATPPPTVWNLPPGTSGLAQNTTHHLDSLLLSLPWPARGGREAQQPYEITASYRPRGQDHSSPSGPLPIPTLCLVWEARATQQTREGLPRFFSRLEQVLGI